MQTYPATLEGTPQPTLFQCDHCQGLFPESHWPLDKFRGGFQVGGICKREQTQIKRGGGFAKLRNTGKGERKSQGDAIRGPRPEPVIIKQHAEPKPQVEPIVEPIVDAQPKPVIAPAKYAEAIKDVAVTTTPKATEPEGPCFIIETVAPRAASDYALEAVALVERGYTQDELRRIFSIAITLASPLHKEGA